MTQPANNPTQGIHHLGLTVPDISRTANFFTTHLNFSVVGSNADYPATFISDGTVMLTLWQAHHPEFAVPFNRHDNIGLHHFALKVADEPTLTRIFEDIRGVDGVTVEFGPEALGSSTLLHMMCTIPGGLRVEFLAA
jgi:catechol 2,3-dioxygenase-like lactoylglutathione lyase family enzyme